MMGLSVDVLDISYPSFSFDDENFDIPKQALLNSVTVRSLQSGYDSLK